jgi:hypothetical protein
MALLLRVFTDTARVMVRSFIIEDGSKDGSGELHSGRGDVFGFDGFLHSETLTMTELDD